MKRLIASLALAGMSALAAQYPLNRVSSVTDERPSGVGTNTVNDIVAEYDRTNLAARIEAKAGTNTVNDLVAEYDRTNLAARIEAKQDELSAGPGIEISNGGIVSVAGYGTVSNRAVNARQLDDNVSHADGFRYGPWDMGEVKEMWGNVPHELRVEPADGKFVWVLYSNSEPEASSPAYDTEREALAATNVVVTGGGRSAAATRESVKTSASGDSFVTWQFVTNNQALADLEGRVNSRTDSRLAVKRDLADNVCASPASRVLDERWDISGLIGRMADRGWGYSLSSPATMTYDDDVGEYVLTFSAKLPVSAGTTYTGRLYGFTGIKTKAEFDNTGRVDLKMYYRGTYGTGLERQADLDSLVSRPYAPIAVPGEPYVTGTFVTNTVADAVAFSVTSNGDGSVSLDADPRKLLFGSVNLSNLVVGIVKEVMKDPEFLETFGISTNDNMIGTAPQYRIRPYYGPAPTGN